MSFSWNDIDERQRSRNEEEKRLKEYLRGQQQEVKERKLRQKKEELQENQRIYGLGGSPIRDNLKSKPPPRSPVVAIAPQAEPVAPDHQYRPPSSLPALPSASLSPSIVTSVPLLQDAAAARTAELESQLAQERRTRTKLELDVQAGKTALSSLSAKLDQLASAVSASQISFRDTAHLAADADRRAREVEQALDARLGSTTVSVKHMIADLDGRHQRQDGQMREDETERYHFVMEQVAGLTHRIELLQARASETGETLRIKTQDLHHESRIGVDAMRMAKAHDSAIENLHAAVDSRVTALERRLEDSIRDLSAKIEAEARTREQVAEAHWAKICAIVSRHERQDYEATDRIEALRGTLTLIADQDREDAKQASAFHADQIKDVKRGMAGTAEKLGERVLAVETRVSAEAAARSALHDQIDSDRSRAIAEAEAQVRKLVDSVRMQNEDGRKHQTTAIAALKDSLRQTEAKVLGQAESLEQVLHAEISQRTEIDSALQKNILELHNHVGNTSKLLISEIESERHENAAKLAAVKADAVKACEDACAVKSRAVHDQDAQLTALRTRFHTFENILTADVQTVRYEFDQLTTHMDNTKKELTASFDERCHALRHELEKHRAASETASAALTADLKEKIHVKALELEQTLRSIMVDMNKRIDKEEFDLMTEKLQTENQILRSDLEKVAQSAPAIEKIPAAPPPLPPDKQQVSDEEFKKGLSDLKAQIDSLARAAAEIRSEQHDINDATKHVTNELAENLLKLQQRQVEILAHISGLQLMVQDAASYDHVSNLQSQLNANVSLATSQLRETFNDRIEDMHKALSDIHAQQDAMFRTEARHRATLQASLTKLLHEREIQCKELASASTANSKAVAHDLATQLQQIRVGLETMVGHLNTRVQDSNQLCKDRSQEMRDSINRIRQEVAIAAAERSSANNSVRQALEPRNDMVPARASKFAVADTEDETTPEQSENVQVDPTFTKREPPAILSQAPIMHPPQVAVTVSPKASAAGTTTEALIIGQLHTSSTTDNVQSASLQPPHSAKDEPSNSTTVRKDSLSATQVILDPATLFKPPHLIASTLPLRPPTPQASQDNLAQSREKRRSGPPVEPAAAAASSDPDQKPMAQEQEQHSDAAPQVGSHKEDLERLADEAMRTLGRQPDIA
ncbi:hypothetical protein HDU86_008194 [Geranomyces michiganensis]|nr:hypothetical protein HDU86_008194 [Geranomyces michiganensis]